MKRHKLFIVEAPCAIIRKNRTTTTTTLRTNNPIKALWSFLRYPETDLSILLSTDGETETIYPIFSKPSHQ